MATRERIEYGITWNNVLDSDPVLGDEVKVNIEIEANRQAEGAGKQALPGASPRKYSVGSGLLTNMKRPEDSAQNRQALEAKLLEALREEPEEMTHQDWNRLRALVKQSPPRVCL